MKIKNEFKICIKQGNEFDCILFHMRKSQHYLMGIKSLRLQLEVKKKSGTKFQK